MAVVSGAAVVSVLRRGVARLRDGPAVVAQPGGGWRWRSAFWDRAGADRGAAALQVLGPGVKLCHDSRHPVPADWRPGRGLRLQTGAFDGSFLSLILDPPGGCAGLGPHHLIAVAFDLRGAAGPVHVRLNLRNGVNLERDICTLSGEGPQVAEFDLFHMPMNPDLLGGMWLDLFLPAVAGAEVVIAEAVVSCRPRAAF